MMIKSTFVGANFHEVTNPLDLYKMIWSTEGCTINYGDGEARHTIISITTSDASEHFFAYPDRVTEVFESGTVKVFNC